MFKRKQKTLQSYKREKSLLIFLFLVIPVGLLILITVYPVASLFFYSFTNWGGHSAPDQFVGLKNYIAVFTTPSYRTVFRTASYYLVAGVLQQILALFFATILSNNIRGGGFFKGTIFFPFIMNGVAVTLIFQMFFEVNGGLDSILAMMGLENLQKLWIADASIVNISLAFIFLWKNVGYSFIIYLGTMQSIPYDLYEAARIDGANAWQQFWHITVPNMKMIIGLLVSFAVVNSVAVFDIPYILTRGYNGTNTFTTTMIETAFKFNLYGEASAMAIVLLLIVSVVLVLKNIIFKEDD